MTQDRTAYWGESEAAARYQTGDDDPTGGDFIVARDLDGQRMLLKFDFTADEWQYAGDVDMGGGDLNSVGTARIDALEASRLNTAPTGSIVQLDGNQSIAPDTSTDLQWETETTRGVVSNLINPTDNVVVVPSGYNFAKVTVNISFVDNVDIEFIQPTLNGSGDFDGNFSIRFGGSLSGSRFNASSAFFPVSENDEIGTQLRHTSEDSEDILDFSRTYMEVVLI